MLPVLGVELGVEGSAEFDWGRIKSGFSRIDPGHFLRYDVDTSASSTVYVSVVTEDGIVIADALPKHDDHSVIIGENARLYDTKHGHLWKDTLGNYHGRKRRSIADGILFQQRILTSIM